MPRKRASFRLRNVGGPPKDQPWRWYSVEMMRSDAWRDMSINARRMLDRLEIEDMAHRGYVNGNLIVTYDQFVAAGIRRESINKTISELEKLGWIEVMRGGYRGFARSWPNRFRLTHRPTRVIPDVGYSYFGDATNEWRHYRSKKLNRLVPKAAPAQCRNRHCDDPNPANEPSDSAAPTQPRSVPVPAPLYISRVEGGGAGRSARNGQNSTT